MTTNKDEAFLNHLDMHIAASIPGYARVDKETSTLMKVLNIVARIFNKNFMTRYTTTVYPKVYVPISKAATSRWAVAQTLSHEWVHLINARDKNPIWHGFLYFFPQSLAPLALLALLGFWLGEWWFFNLSWLVCLLPFPAPFRAEEEFKAYTMSMAAMYWRNGYVTMDTVAWIGSHFTSSDYYFMWPFPKKVKDRLGREYRAIIQGEYDEIWPYSRVKFLIEQNYTDVERNLWKGSV